MPWRQIRALLAGGAALVAGCGSSGHEQGDSGAACRPLESCPADAGGDAGCVAGGIYYPVGFGTSTCSCLALGDAGPTWMCFM